MRRGRTPYNRATPTPYEKFEAWANTLPKCVGNPLYHWAHMELKTYFGFDEPLSGKNSQKML